MTSSSSAPRRAVRRLSLVLVALVTLTTAGPALAAQEPPGSTSPSRAGTPRLAIGIADRSLEVTRGRQVAVPVTVVNRGTATARSVRVQLVLPSGVTASRTTVPVGNLARNARRTVRVGLVLKSAGARRVTVRAVRAGGGGTVSTTVVLRPRAAAPTATAWRGNFSGPTADGIGFTLSADRRTITGWRAPQIDGYCAYMGSAFAWYPTADLPPIAVGADGRFDASFEFPPSNPDDFAETARITGTVTGSTVSNGTLAYEGTYEYGGSTAFCTISNAQEVWSAARS